ncbi:MAG: MBOAT family O-acyltransferase [Bacteroidota bacterium]
MLFNSFIFLIFLAAGWLVYVLLPRRRWRVWFLLAASYFFYGYWDWRFTILLLLSTTVDYAVGRALGAAGEQRRRRRLLLASCAVNLGILGFFKYFDFFTESAEAAAGALGLPLELLHLNLVLPVGISFYTFKTLSYTIDVYRRTIPPTRSFTDYALFVGFFPNLVAGPIDRAGSILPQISRLARPRALQVREGLVLIVTGLFMKVLIGDASARIVNNIFGQPELYRAGEVLAAWVLFGIQVYADFAGYSNIARGAGRLFGVELMKNFDQPYLSSSFSEFWRRWHISLSTWIWDYIFNPLMTWRLRRAQIRGADEPGGQMRSAYAYAVIVTMLLCGLWHGAGFVFVLWGGIHGLYLAVERLLVYRGKTIPLRRRIRSAKSLVRFAAGWVSTQALVGIAWILFRSGSLGEAGRILGRIAAWEPSEHTARLAAMTLVFGMAVMGLDLAERRGGGEFYLLRLRPATAAAVCCAATAAVLLYMATTKPLPFVYFQF